MKASTSKLFICAMLSVGLIGCATSPYRNVTQKVTATVVSVKKTPLVCAEPSGSGGAILVGALIGGFAGSKLGGGNMKKVNALLLGTAGGVAGNNLSKRGKEGLECKVDSKGKYTAMMSFADPSTMQTIRKPFKTTARLRTGEKVQFDYTYRVLKSN